MKSEHDFQRLTRTAPSRHFSGGYTGHGPIESAIDDYRAQVGPIRPLFVGGACVIGLACACVWLAAGMVG